MRPTPGPATRFSTICTLLTAALLATSSVFAVSTVKTPTELDPLVRWDPTLYQGREVAAYAAVAGELPNAAAWTRLVSDLGPVYDVYVDRATGEPALVKGKPVELIPGAGNALSLAQVSAALGRPVAAIDEEVLIGLGNVFLDEHIELFRVPRQQLALAAAHRVSDSFWVVTYRHLVDGVPVRDSRVTLVVRHGNLVLWGSENVFADDGPSKVESGLGAAAAIDALGAYIGWDDKRDSLLAEPEPVQLVEGAGEGLLGGGGKRHRLVWELVFRRQGVRGTWLAHVDAASGAIVELGDLNRYAWIRGGIEPTTWTDAEESRPMPFVRLNGGGTFSSLEGLFTPGGGTDTGTLDGELTRIQDQCGGAGFPSVDSDGSGNINFGGGPPNPAGDADCTNNGVGNSGGDHNTHAARSAYYHISRVKERVRQWLPGNSWVDSSHDVLVNINNVCNAYWSPGGGFNGFFQEGFSGALHCFNTGEIAGIFQHEVGHGLDQNDAQGTADGGTGEAYGDVLAMLDLHESCNGQEFWSQQCTGYGLPCTECSGVRDADYAKHETGGGVPITTPFTPANYTGPFCPPGGFGVGPCGREVHCEAYPGTGAVWDLAVRKLTTGFDQDTAWFQTERNWMLGMQTATAMFNCNSGTFASDGCAATSWFQAMLAADDDDGNLANGTPHAAFIFDAFNDHAIACGSDADAENQNNSGCPSLATPVLTASTLAGIAGGAATIDLDWNAVANAQGYAVLKNHGDCDRSYVIRTTIAGTSFSDADVADHQAYSYRVVALGGAGGPQDNACYSDLSNCAEATISACPAATGSAPGLSNPVDNQVDVAWDDAGTCSSFKVERREDGCGGADFTVIASGLGGSPYSDTTVSGGVTYGYRITAVDPTGQFETGASPCAEITPTGVCNEAPSFDPGLTAANSETLDCGIDLDWGSGSTICPAQSVVYNLYRSTTGGFSPGDGNRVATALTSTTYHDDDVDSGVEYFYVVRAEALTGAGPGPNGGVEDLNLEEASAAATGPFASFFSDDVEGGTGNWATSAGPSDTGTSPWGVVSTDSHSPTQSWFVSDESVIKDQRLDTASPIAVTGAGAFLSFWHRFVTEATYDGGVLEYSTDGGSNWFDILDGDGGNVPADPDRIVQNGYTGTISTGFSSPIGGREAWEGNSGGFQQVIVDLSDFNGESVTLRWRMGCDSSVSSTGWWVDDVEVLVGSECSNDGEIFVDGFESGDTSLWSGSSP